MMNVSVLVPSYNHAPFVEQTLRSIFAQTSPPEKLIVIDDGSKDESAEIIEKVLRDCPFDFEFIKRENRGLCATLNEGFAKTSGDFFAYLGSDDVWLPDFLERRVKLLESRPKTVLAFGHSYLIDEENNIIDSTENWTDYASGDILPMLLRGIIFLSPSVVYRRAALAKHGWNENSILEDYELYLKLSGAGGEFAFDKTISCAWRQHGSNVSGDFPLMLAEWIAAQNRAAGYLKISRGELDKIQTELKFNSAFDYIRHGKKREAFKLARENFHGAKSLKQVSKMFLRFIVPQKFFQWNRRRKQRDAIKNYGKLKLDL
ncbi:MAG: glycosyltransferase family 2 protein [Pyrinomonadaceae bacterium]